MPESILIVSVAAVRKTTYGKCCQIIPCELKDIFLLYSGKEIFSRSIDNGLIISVKAFDSLNNSPAAWLNIHGNSSRDQCRWKNSAATALLLSDYCRVNR